MQIKLDPTLAAQLTKLGEVVELCDPSGRILGRFIPTVDLSEWEPITPGVSDEELRRRAAPGRKRYTTAEVLAYLERL